MKKLLILLAVVAVAWWILSGWGSAPAPDPGVRVGEKPAQTETAVPPWTEGNYTIRPLARYKIQARVLSKKRYWMGDFSDICPLDLALGWGEMSDTGVLEHISISQGGRWYEFTYGGSCPISHSAIATQSANVHCLPADATARRDLSRLKVNSFAELSGFLVEVQTPGLPEPWRSSLARDDEGAGACEVFWVTDVREIAP
jgi:hypothetical protein